ncbi:hypothetical protein BX661DRAFT_184791 [Kickxella alabastrina]|uniref:uncharacterized protein n=1 Tax=Kickxella alabastrina TaxID=61397 RepID=UPI00221E3FC2|nr:uncharacterized protein BX661DRAFT_184791 [Kickxella alabastrina]KAI7825539.1 hypothetical protein BX661DRAFT_184791 [Kickxella alabastrina]
MTYAIRASLRSGEICNNLVILRGQGILQTSEGVKIAYIGGNKSESVIQAEETQDGVAEETADKPAPDTDNAETIDIVVDDQVKDLGAAAFNTEAMADLITQVASENEKAFQKTQSQPSIDILLTYDWPFGVLCKDQLGEKVMRAPSASNKISYLNATIMPHYHFAASEGQFYERLPWTETEAHFTRFIGLGSVNNSEHGKQRWFYAMNVKPLQASSQGKVTPNAVPDSCTPNPLYQFAKLNSVLDSKVLDKVISGINAMQNIDSRDRPNDNSQGRRQPPPVNYVCKICKQPGHWIQDCPSKEESKRQRTDNLPPAKYVCKKCNQSGHWVSECPDAAANAAAATAKICLINLMVAIGNEAYMTISKGALVISGDKDASGFEGHAALFQAVATLRRARNSDSDSDKSLCAEIGRWVGSVAGMFAGYGCIPLVFETCRFFPHVHTTLQIVPIPMAKAATFRDTLNKLCEEDGLEVCEGHPESHIDGYFAFNDITSMDGKELFIRIQKRGKAFNLQFGRRLAARILEIPEREDWRKCVVSEEAEASERDKFIAAFAAFDFTRETEPAAATN